MINEHWDSEFCSFWYSISLVYSFLLFQLPELFNVEQQLGALESGARGTIPLLPLGQYQMPPVLLILSVV